MEKRKITTAPADGSPMALSVREAARRLGISFWTLHRMGAEGRGPRRVRIGRRVLYRPVDLEKFLAENEEVPA